MTVITKTLGPIVIGVLLSTFFFGFVTMQTYTYFSNFPKDRQSLKILVAFVWCVELGHQLSITHAFWWLMVQNYGHVEVLVTTGLTWSITGYIFFNGLASLAVCSFFIYRLRKVTGQVLVPFILTLLSAGRTAGNISLVVYSRIRKSNVDLVTNSRTLLITCWSLAVAVDVLLALALTFDLYMRRRESSYRLARTVDRIILWTVATGFMTGTCVVLMLILFVALPGTNLTWEVIYMPMPRLFALSLLSSLNARFKIRRGEEGPSAYEPPVRELVVKNPGASTRQEVGQGVAWEPHINSNIRFETTSKRYPTPQTASTVTQTDAVSES